jgi:hypothetical protein
MTFGEEQRIVPGSQWLVAAVALLGWTAGSAVAHPGHGALHTTEGQVSVALLSIVGLGFLAGSGQLYAEGAVSRRGAALGGVLGGTVLAAAALLVWPVV